MTNGDDVPDPRGGPRAAVVWFLRTDHAAVLFLRDAASSALTVAMVGLLLFSVSGVWPPLVAVESGSMQPNMQKGDLVFVMEEQRFAPEYATGETGVVTHADATAHDYRQFGGFGDVIVYQPYGDARATPVIHRARFWVDEGENWYSKADPEYVTADDCDALRNCPAPHAGFVTKGDNSVTNDYYDQTRGISSIVKPAWVKGTAEYRVPYLGWVRLTLAGTLTPGTVSADTAASADGAVEVADSSAGNASGVALTPVT